MNTSSVLEKLPSKTKRQTHYGGLPTERTAKVLPLEMYSNYKKSKKITRFLPIYNLLLPFPKKTSSNLEI